MGRRGSTTVGVRGPRGSALFRPRRPAGLGRWSLHRPTAPWGRRALWSVSRAGLRRGARPCPASAVRRGGPHPSAGLSRGGAAAPDALCGSEGPLRLRRLQGRAPSTGVAPPGRGQRKPRPPGPEASLLCEGRGLPAGDSLGSRGHRVSQLGGRRLQERRASSWGAVGSDTRAYAYCGHSHPSVLGVQVFQPSGSRGACDFASATRSLTAAPRRVGSWARGGSGDPVAALAMPLQKAVPRPRAPSGAPRVLARHAEARGACCV